MKNIILAAVLAVIFAFGAGCGKKTQNPPGEYALKPVTSMPVFEDDGSYEYYIGGGNGPAQADEKAMRILSECGINHIMLPNTTIAPSLMKTIIKNAAKYGVKAYPQMMGKITATPEEFFNHVFDDSLGEKGLAGFCYYDEPMTDKFDGFVRLVENHNEKYKDLDFFINLYGEIYYNDLPQNTTESYMEYVMMYCSKVLSKVEGRRILSVDHYPLQWSKSTQDNFRISPTWLQTCEVIAHNAKTYDAMSHYYLTSTEHYDYRKPTEQRLRYEVNVYMTYGAQGVSHFGYSGDASGVEPKKFENSMVGADGLTIRPFYYEAQKVNREILAWDHVFLRYDWQGVMNVLGEGNDSNKLFDNTSLSLNSLPNLEYISASGDTLVGYFEDEEGQPAYMITNIGDPDVVKEPDVVNFAVADATAAVLYRRGNAENVKLDNGAFTLEIGAGEAVFVIPVNLVNG